MTLDDAQALVNRGPYLSWLGVKVLNFDKQFIEVRATWRQEWIANPTLQQNPNLIVAGRTYVIPPGGSTPASAAPSQQPVAQQQPSQPTPTPTPAKAPEQPTQVATATPQYFYTVKAGDSLTKIAVMQLGNADAVPAIMDLNKDTLKGKETIRPNMKLRLPAKPLASAD